MNNSHAIILAGGSGSRLWPLSRNLRPKQLLPLDGEQTLLQQTANRLLKHVDVGCLLTVTHQDHKFEVKGQLAEVDAQLPASVLAEPCARNTLPAIAWAVWEICKQDQNAMIGVFPSDHAISDEQSFLSAWRSAELAAAEGYLVLLGITPSEPATGYGYIHPGESLGLGAAYPILNVSRFVEKPDLDNAKRFVEDGYLWNSGMFVFRANVFMQMLEQHQPEIHRAITAMQGMDDVEASYNTLPNLSIDYGLAEKANKVAVVPVAMGWSDLGSWDSIYQHRVKDNAGNVTQGDVLSLETEGSLLWSSNGLLATLGVQNIAVIQTADATLVCDRTRTEYIKQLVALVQKTHPHHLIETHTTVHRPWGVYRVLEEGANFKIKCIIVNPGAKLSMQMHKHRAEHWVVVTGTAKITNGTQEFQLEANQSTYIPKTHRHRLENPGDIPLQIIEVQCGDYVGEDDIVRFDDTYGRNVG
jgi:mannose-1-phosphate guanylyltransferase/mannose-6-phosphate isomerase